MAYALNLSNRNFRNSLGILLSPILTRRTAAWGIIILLIMIFPANIYMMMNYLNEKNPGLWITILRLPLQFVLIWWAYTFTKKQVWGN